MTAMDGMEAIGIMARVEGASQTIALIEIAAAIALANPDNERGVAARRRVKGYLAQLAEYGL